MQKKSALLILSGIALAAVSFGFGRMSAGPAADASRAPSADEESQAAFVEPKLEGEIPAPTDEERSQVVAAVRAGSGVEPGQPVYEPWIPKALHPRQVRASMKFANTQVMQVVQRNLWWPIENPGATKWEESYYQGPFVFAGYMAYLGGDENGWRRLVSVPRYKVGEYDSEANPVGLHVWDKKLCADFADPYGAGSGEGTLTRYVTTDARTWTYVGCNYYTIEGYEADARGYLQKPPPRGFGCEPSIPKTLTEE